MINQGAYTAGLEAGMALRIGHTRGDLTDDDLLDMGVKAMGDVLNEDLPSPTRLRAGEWLLGYARGLQTQ